jgi:pilus assembly protein CpaB
MKRLTPASLTLLMLGVVGLLVVGYIAKNLLAREDAAPEDPILSIPMALSDMEPGTIITEGHLGLGRARESTMTPETIRTNRVLLGRTVKEKIVAARPILTTQLYPPGEYPPLQLEPGMRAVSISFDGSSASVDGLVRPGHYVDVHFTPSGFDGEATTGGLTMTLFKGVKVLAINRSTRGSGAPGRGGNTVTLELTEQQANIIILARDKGELNLTYTPTGKGDGGVAVSREDRATLNEILGLEPPQEPEPPFTSEIYYGSGRHTNTFEKNGRRVEDSGYNTRDFQGRQAPQATRPGAAGQQMEVPRTGVRGPSA